MLDAGAGRIYSICEFGFVHLAHHQISPRAVFPTGRPPVILVTGTIKLGGQSYVKSCPGVPGMVRPDGSSKLLFRKAAEQRSVAPGPRLFDILRDEAVRGEAEEGLVFGSPSIFRSAKKAMSRSGWDDGPPGALRHVFAVRSGPMA